METPVRLSYPDSTHNGRAQLNDWIAKPYSIVFTIVVFFIIIFGSAIFLASREFEATRNKALMADRTTANLLADLILEHNKGTIGILESYAHRPLFIDAVKNKDLSGIHRHLSDLKKNADIDLTFVTDTHGICFVNYPVFPEAIGKDLSYRDWYKGITSHWKPYISTVFKLIVGDKPLAVAVCVAIFDGKERPIGILATSQRLRFLVTAIERVPLSPDTIVTVVDRAGKILYSNKVDYQGSITDYRFFPTIESAIKNKKQQIEIKDPQKDQERSYLTVVPVGEMGSSIIIERSLQDIYRSEFRRFIEIGVVSFLLFLLIISFLIYLRKISLFRKTEGLLQAESHLRQSEESGRETRDYLDKLIGYANAPIIVWDPQFIITRFNHAFEDLTGLKAEEVLGKGIDLLFPEDRRAECLAHIRQTTGGARWEVIEIPILHRDGSVRTVLWNSATIYSQDGKTVVAIIAQGQDITERKQIEEKNLRQSKLLAAVNSVFYETLTADSEEAVAKTCLKVAQELTDSKFGFIGEITSDGFFTTTALSDPGWEACRIPETQANTLIKNMAIRGIWGQVILKEQSLLVNDPFSYPDRVGIPEGHPPLTSFLGVPLRDQGKVIGMIAMGNRISGYAADQQRDMEALSVAFVEAIRRKKAEEEIKKLNTELEQRVIDRTAQLSASNKELEAFSYSVSHDLRAPLRSIDGFSQALLEEYQDKPLDATGKNFLERVRKAIQRMGLLIDDMLKLSRITQAQMKREPIDLSGMVREIEEAQRKGNSDRVVDVTVQEGVMVQGDPYLIKIAMENLVDNAFKFTGKEAHPRIEFGTAVRDGKTACFVRDNGAGFDMAYVDKLFGAFQRLHTTDEFPGTGIGLATVQRIIHRHGGEVQAEGKVGKGATFYFTLP